MVTRKSIWNKIRGEFAKQHGPPLHLTYEEVASRAKMPLMTVYNALSGQKTPSIDRAEAIALALGLDLDLRK